MQRKNVFTWGSIFQLSRDVQEVAKLGTTSNIYGEDHNLYGLYMDTCPTSSGLVSRMWAESKRERKTRVFDSESLTHAFVQTTNL